MSIDDKIETYLTTAITQEVAITVSVPLFIRLLEFAREDANNDLILHKITERALEIGSYGKQMLSMQDYNNLIRDK